MILLIISVAKNDEAAKIIIAIKKSMNNTLERKVNNTPKMIAVNWEAIIALDKTNGFIW